EVEDEFPDICGRQMDNPPPVAEPADAVEPRGVTSSPPQSHPPNTPMAATSDGAPALFDLAPPPKHRWPKPTPAVRVPGKVTTRDGPRPQAPPQRLQRMFYKHKPTGQVGWEWLFTSTEQGGGNREDAAMHAKLIMCGQYGARGVPETWRANHGQDRVLAAAQGEPSESWARPFQSSLHAGNVASCRPYLAMCPPAFDPVAAAARSCGVPCCCCCCCCCCWLPGVPPGPAQSPRAFCSAEGSTPRRPAGEAAACSTAAWVVNVGRKGYGRPKGFNHTYIYIYIYIESVCLCVRVFVCVCVCVCLYVCKPVEITGTKWGRKISDMQRRNHRTEKPGALTRQGQLFENTWLDCIHWTRIHA
ncbi:hypothetical protein Vretifemale_19929, partial [Volvox reticuliferus]